jgi:glycosyltransferase involved in cell wall biosynthesis
MSSQERMERGQAPERGPEGSTLPLVSIVIPTYNGGPYIEQAMRSALAQTLRDLEIVVVDDASSDDTLDRVARLADGRVRVQTADTNAGAGVNWNRALRAARGRYVKLLCQDDVLAPTCVERQVEAFESHLGAGATLCSVRRVIIDERGRPMTQRGFPRHTRAVVPGPRAARRLIRSGGNPVGEPSAVLFRKEDALRVGLFDEAAQYVIDIDLWLRLLAEGSLLVIPEPLAAFRISTSSWSAALSGEQSRQYRLLTRRVSRDPRLAIRRRDVLVSYVMAYLLEVVRRTLYARARLQARAARRGASPAG